jgi:hypothetical protein
MDNVPIRSCMCWRLSDQGALDTLHSNPCTEFLTGNGGSLHAFAAAYL